MSRGIISCYIDLIDIVYITTRYVILGYFEQILVLPLQGLCMSVFFILSLAELLGSNITFIYTSHQVLLVLAESNVLQIVLEQDLYLCSGNPAVLKKTK